MPRMHVIGCYVQPTLLYREFNGMRLSSHLGVEDKGNNLRMATC
ncbi:hypothetical protein SPSIL_035280 [Sporomusa silvacetica DSM 10669]|uniref:Uncharacterized protein n=1 Tax=Sporomusa silvacetica DSM 10669 TaxID=1123289 RepID=A0ABZ3INN8_9FIRM|nr:hypothetical protein SPSIL_40040 [Sporomusa silvacetica DSM 10669]